MCAYIYIYIMKYFLINNIFYFRYISNSTKSRLYTCIILLNKCYNTLIA